MDIEYIAGEAGQSGFYLFLAVFLLVVIFTGARIVPQSEKHVYNVLGV